MQRDNCKKRSLSLVVHEMDSDIRVGSWYFTRVLQNNSFECEILPAPVSPFHIFKLYKKDARRKLGRLLGNLIKRRGRFHTFFSLMPAGPIWPFSSSFFLRKFPSLSIVPFRDSNFDFVYCDNLYTLGLLSHVKYNFLVIRVPDSILSGSYALPGHHQVFLKYFLRKADLVICASEVVQRELNSLCGNSSLVITNGVELARFKQIKPCPDELNTSRIKLIFVGTFDYWLNMDLIDTVGASFPDCDIMLIGDASLSVSKTVKAKNVFFLGSRSPRDVVSYLQHGDIGIVPFDTINHKEFVDGINPLKVYEYLAAGIPVVSTDFAGAHGISPYVTTASTPEAFCQAVQNFLDSPPDREAVKKSVERYDWSVVLKPFEDFVRKSLDKSEG